LINLLFLAYFDLYLTTRATPDYAIDVGRNVCHGSDSVENAKKEIALWFKEGEVLTWKSAQHDWIYEKA
jgi:nucleoside-diphosphate kinase